MQHSADETAKSNRRRAGSILRTGAALLSVQGLTWLSSLLGIMVIPRFLGASDFGFLATAATTVAVATMLAGFGTMNYRVKESARSPERVRELVVNATAWRAVVWVALCLVGTPALYLLVDSATLLTLLLVAAVAGTFALVQSALLAGLQGIERLGRTALGVSIVALSGNAVMVVLLVTGGNVIGVAVLTASTAGASLLVTIIAFLRFTSGPFQLSWRLIRRTAVAGPPYLAWDLGLMVYGTIDLVILAALVDSSTVGSYAFAFRLIGIPIFAATIITMAVYPSLSASALGGDEWFRRLLSHAVRLTFLVTAPMALGIALLANGIVDLLAGAGFDGAPILVAILALHIPPAAVHTVLGMALFAKDVQRRMALLAWTAAAFNVIANAVAIPFAEQVWSNGAIGAAAVKVATEAIIGVMVWRWAWGLIDRPEIFSLFVRVLGASACMAFFVVLVDASLGFWPAVAAGVGSYLGASLLFGSISLQVIRRATKFARRSFGGLAEI